MFPFNGNASCSDYNACCGTTPFNTSTHTCCGNQGAILDGESEDGNPDIKHCCFENETYAITGDATTTCVAGETRIKGLGTGTYINTATDANCDCIEDTPEETTSAACTPTATQCKYSLLDMSILEPCQSDLRECDTSSSLAPADGESNVCAECVCKNDFCCGGVPIDKDARPGVCTGTATGDTNAPNNSCERPSWEFAAVSDAQGNFLFCRYPKA